MEIITREEKMCRSKFISKMSEHMSEEEAFVLAYLCIVKKRENDTNNIHNFSVTARDIINHFHLEKNKVRFSLKVLEITTFIEKHRIDHSWSYNITEEGITALNYLLNEKKYPGRKIKFLSIIKEADSTLNS